MTPIDYTTVEWSPVIFLFPLQITGPVCYKLSASVLVSDFNYSMSCLPKEWEFLNEFLNRISVTPVDSKATIFLVFLCDRAHGLSWLVAAFFLSRTFCVLGPVLRAMHEQRFFFFLNIELHLVFILKKCSCIKSVQNAKTKNCFFCFFY